MLSSLTWQYCCEITKRCNNLKIVEFVKDVWMKWIIWISAPSKQKMAGCSFLTFFHIYISNRFTFTVIQTSAISIDTSLSVSWSETVFYLVTLNVLGTFYIWLIRCGLSDYSDSDRHLLISQLFGKRIWLEPS